MKKLIFAAAVLSLLLCGCGNNEPPPPPTVPLLTEAPHTEPTATEPPVTLPTAATTEGTQEATLPNAANGENDDLSGPAITATVTGTKTVNVRRGPSSRTKLIKKLNKGDKVLIYQTTELDGKRWCRTEDGWIYMKYLDLMHDLSELGPTPGIPGIVRGANTVNVRQEPSTRSEKVAELQLYDFVNIYETKDVDGVEWGRIDAGWVCLKYLELDKTPQDTDVMKSNTAATPKEENAQTFP